MKRELTNRNCPLWDTETCARMNMRACRGCPAEGKDLRECDDIRGDVDTLYSLLPEEGVSALFTGETCTLCKGENKGKRECYGLFDMGHADPRSRKKKLSLFRKKTYGFVVPLQFGCCGSCRRRYQLLGWLRMLVVILITGATLLVVAREPVAQDLRNIWRGLPLLVMVLAGGISFLLGKVLTDVLRARFNRRTYMDLKDHPKVQSMSALGWECIAEEKYPQPVFTRKRLSYGVGTVIPQDDSEKKEDDSEILD